MYYFIINETGGGGNAVYTWNRVSNELKKRSIAFRDFHTQKNGDATTYAHKIGAIVDKEKRLIVVGGDGTINEVLNGLYEAHSFSDILFGVIPTGSGNDFARGLGLPNSTDEVLDRIINSSGTQKIDLGLVRLHDGRERIFGISAGFGLDAIVCKKTIGSKLKTFLNKIHLGSFIYRLITIQTLFTMKTEHVAVTSTNEGTSQNKSFDNLIFMACMNFRAEGGGVPMAPDAKATDGKLSICLASDIPKWKAFLDLPLLVLAKHKKLKGFSLWDCQETDFASLHPLTLHTDGEYVGEVNEAHFRILPSCLSILS